MFKRALFLFFVILGLSATSVAQTEARERSLALSFGTFGVLDTEELFEVSLEYRAREIGYGLRPIVGASVLQDGGNYVFAGLRYEHDFTEKWQVAPSFAAGIYSAGFDCQHKADSHVEGMEHVGRTNIALGLQKGKNRVGCPGGGIDRRITDDLSFGVGFYHLSNGGLYSLNGGSESLVFTLGYDF